MISYDSDDYPDEELEEQPAEEKKPKSDKSKSRSEENGYKKKKHIRKYTSNGSLPLHEAVVVAGQPLFACYSRTNGEAKLQLFKYIETYDSSLILSPADTIHSQNPIPYIFESPSELKDYLQLASKETLDSLYSKVETILRKYVNAEDHYITVLSGDIIYSYFQDKFGTTHYNIFVGDNGSGKNSALLVFKYLGYRVFYGLSISAPNYFTFLGDWEECQGSTAEDEAEDIAYDRDKKKIMKGGYCSGASVPKVDLSIGRRQDSWLTYCHKWFAMEELPDYKNMKGILDRSFVYNFVVGKVPYNIKDVIRSAGDSEHRKFFNELIHIRKLLFSFRLLYYKDELPDVKLNVIHRNEEVTKPLLRLFSYRNDSPVALEKIRLALSKFILGKNESKKGSIESRLLDVINCLIEHNREKEPDKVNELKHYAFYNEDIWPEVRSLLEGTDIFGKDGNPMAGCFYSIEYGKVTQKRVTSLYKSKLKADPVRDSKTGKRGLKFSKDVLERLALYYNVPTEIEIIVPTHSTHPTRSRGLGGDENTQNETKSDAHERENHAQNEVNNGESNVCAPLGTVGTVGTVGKECEEQAERKRIVLEDEQELKFQPYVHRVSLHSDRWKCDFCNYRDDRWGIAKHFHTSEEMSKGPRKGKD